MRWLTDFLDDFRYALRSLRHTPGLAVFLVATLALGIGLTAAPFSMVDALIFRPYPVPSPGNVVTLASTSRDSAFEMFSHREYLDIRDHTRSYDGVIANAPLAPIGFAIIGEIVIKRQWRGLFHPKWLLAGGVAALFFSPGLL